MNRQTLIYIAIGVGLLLVLALVNRSSQSAGSPVVSLPSAGENKDAAYYANQISKIDWNAIGNAIKVIAGGDGK